MRADRTLSRRSNEALESAEFRLQASTALRRAKELDEIEVSRTSRL